MSTACLYQACICHYTACIGCSETAGCILGCREKGEMCCCGSESCCYPGGESHGMCACKETQNTEFCRFAPMPCCECFCKSPQVCSKGYAQYCCIYNVSSCPFDKVCLCTICPHAPATRSYGHTVIRSYSLLSACGHRIMWASAPAPILSVGVAPFPARPGAAASSPPRMLRRLDSRRPIRWPPKVPQSPRRK